MTTFKFLSECSAEALRQVLDPETSRELNCPLADVLLRSVVVELLQRGESLDLDDPIIRRAMVGPDRCKHDRSIMGTCGSCDTEDHVVLALHKLSEDFRKEARAVKDQPYSSWGAPVVDAYERTYLEASEKIDRLKRAIIEGDDFPEEDTET